MSEKIGRLNAYEHFLFTVLDLEGLETRANQAGICAVVSKAQGWNLLKSIETAVPRINSVSR